MDAEHHLKVKNIYYLYAQSIKWQIWKQTVKYIEAKDRQKMTATLKTLHKGGMSILVK